MPALWGPIPDSDWQRHEPYNPPHDTGNRSFISVIDQIYHLPFQGDYHSQDVHQTDDCNQHPDQTIEVPHALQRKKWSDLDDKRRKQLEVQISLILNSCQATHDLQIGGGLSVGASLIGGGYHAWRQNGDKKISDEQVSFLLHYYDFSRTYHRRRNKFLLGVSRDGYVMLMRAPRSSATTVLVAPRPGFLLRDVTRFLAQLYRSERTKMAIRTILHGCTSKIAPVRLVD